MPHALTKEWEEYRKDCIEQNDEELAGRMEDYGTLSKSRIARMVYEQRQVDRKHKLDLELLEKQAQILKLNNWIIVTATILAALLGAIVQSYLQRSYQLQPTEAMQTYIQSGSESSTSLIHSAPSTGKVPSTSLSK